MWAEEGVYFWRGNNRLEGMAAENRTAAGVSLAAGESTVTWNSKAVWNSTAHGVSGGPWVCAM